MAIPVVIQLKICEQYKGQSISKALYALEVADGYYQCCEIDRQLRKIK